MKDLDLTTAAKQNSSQITVGNSTCMKMCKVIHKRYDSMGPTNNHSHRQSFSAVKPVKQRALQFAKQASQMLKIMHICKTGTQTVSQALDIAQVKPMILENTPPITEYEGHGTNMPDAKYAASGEVTIEFRHTLSRVNTKVFLRQDPCHSMILLDGCSQTQNSQIPYRTAHSIEQIRSAQSRHVNAAKHNGRDLS